MCWSSAEEPDRREVRAFIISKLAGSTDLNNRQSVRPGLGRISVE